MIHLTINGKAIEAPDGVTILEAARLYNIGIPSLCHLKDIHPYGSCRICVVEVEGMKNLAASCIVKAKEGMVVHTHSSKVRAARKVLYELLLSDHPKDCLNCTRNQNCELQELGYTLGVTESRLSGEMSPAKVDVSPSITRDTSKCVLCRRCVTVCNRIQEVGAIGAQNRGFATVVSPAMGLPLDSTACAMCGQCTVVCPTGALTETDGLSKVWAALENPVKRVVVQVAPAVRAALGEEFGLPAGTLVTGKMASALHEIGFDDVFDTDFAADLTIIEEGTELLGRLSAALTGGEAALPMLTSCSPGWIKHIEHKYPAQLGHLSSCKSPHTMLGALVKSFYAEKIGRKPEEMFVVSVMPCTAKKYEIQRPEMGQNGIPDVDAVLTTRELARMIKASGIDFLNLPEGGFDRPLGLSTGAADIFGVTGGVMEAALRTVYELVTGRELPFDGLHVTPIVGLEQVKTASLTIEGALPDFAHLEGVTVRIAVTSGLAGADILMDQIAAGKSPYHFVEVMGCPGGCINGGGQPRPKEEGCREKRAAALYREDEGKPMRKSHENPDITALYEEYLGAANGHLAHELLHTHYVPRGLYNQLVR
ncbi:ferredoxin [Anaerotruncus sp. AF02-27]|uniref:NADH-dependent [FeFe] hydrogenase, group A6 n=1 Tax=Anaerotruncus sp. AF02-27 TaxID=2292191 RepID=UPI000E4EB8BE|nr:NADH-dependent [FeFe] hydrogenase, group A6 [Anaerotruncus sp. AF02-27]RGX54992.1 ferredoxin [Anaerotruncus sp. AF02-27]